MARAMNSDGAAGVTIRMCWPVSWTCSARTSDGVREVSASAAPASHSRERIRQESSPPRSELEAWDVRTAPGPGYVSHITPASRFLMTKECSFAQFFVRRNVLRQGQATMREFTEDQPVPIRPKRHFLPIVWPLSPFRACFGAATGGRKILVRETCLAVAMRQG